MTAMISYIREEEKARIGSNLSDKPIREFACFNEVGRDSNLAHAFQEMQDIYVFSPNDILSIDQLSQAMDNLFLTLLQLDESL